MIKVCFVCLGNICRSPTAEGIFLGLVARHGLDAHVEIDSAGTSAFHAGEAADARSRATARQRGVDLPSRARQFEPRDFARFDYIIAMDRKNLGHLQQLARSDDDREKVHLLRTFAPNGHTLDGSALDVPDPYYGGARGFDDVFDICQAGCEGLLEHIVRTHSLPTRH